MSLCLREARAEDCAPIAQLHRSALAQVWQEQDFLGWLHDPLYRVDVCEQAGILHGYVVARVVQGEAEIIALAVAEPYRRQGTARALLTQILEEASILRCFLEVAQDNHAAWQLYLSLGFVPCGVRQHYYTDGTNAQVLAWQRENHLQN